MFDRLKLFILMLLMIISVNGVVYGSMLELQFKADVYAFGMTDGIAFDGSVAVGGEITGYIRYDSEAVDLVPLNDGYGLYVIDEFFVEVGNYRFHLNPGSDKEAKFVVESGYEYTLYYNYSANIDPIYYEGQPTIFDDLHLAFVLDHKYIYKYFDDSLPTAESFIGLDAFYGDKRVTIARDTYHENGVLHEGFGIQGNITEINIVPEPVSVVLLGVGGLVLRRKGGK